MSNAAGDINDNTKGIQVLLFAVLVVAALTAFGMGVRHGLHGNLNFIHFVFSLFFSINLLICYWEACLYWRRGQIAQRAEYWRSRHQETGHSPAMAFLTSRVPVGQLLSPAVWADVWAAYAHFDDSYTDQGSFGFNADIANGLTSWIPTVILYAAYTVNFLPATAAGIIGVMLFWQWVYVSSLYWVSFRLSGRHQRISARDMWIYVWSLNFIWIAVPAFGLYVSVRLILDGNYQLLGI